MQDKQLSQGMEHEHQELISRLAQVQQLKWDLEEKVAFFPICSLGFMP